MVAERTRTSARRVREEGVYCEIVPFTKADAAFEAQLDGAFADETAGIAWLRQHLHLH